MRAVTMFSAVAALVGSVTMASAADLSYKDTPYEAPLAPIWGGLYVGGHVGGLWNDGGDTSKYARWKDRNCRGNCVGEWSDWKKISFVKFAEEDDDVTLLGGLHIGYNWQSGARVFGIEADASFGDGVDYLATLRARLGYAMDNLLLYVTAGVAFAGFDDQKVTMSIGKFSKGLEFGGDSEIGFVVGAGAEYKLSSNWSIGVEGLYYAFGDGEDTLTKEWERFCTEFKTVHEDDNDMFVVRARLTYHFQDEYAEPLK